MRTVRTDKQIIEAAKTSALRAAWRCVDMPSHAAIVTAWKSVGIYNVVAAVAGAGGSGGHI